MKKNSKSIIKKTCHVTGLPIIIKPEWTDISLGKGYSVTFKIIGEDTLLSIPNGKADKDGMGKFFEERSKIINRVFGRNKKFFELKDYSKIIGKPEREGRNIFIHRMLEDADRLEGFIGFNASIWVKLNMDVSKYFHKSPFPMLLVKNYEEAIKQKSEILKGTSNLVAKVDNCSQENISPEKKRNESETMVTGFSDEQQREYLSQFLNILGDINRDEYGFDYLKDIDSSHPFRPAFEAISLMKIDFDDMIKDQKRTEEINRTLVTISNAVNTTFNLKELFRSIHKTLGKIINTTNFYIALYDKETRSLNFPFHVDEFDSSMNAYQEIPDIDDTPSLTARVIRTGKPVMIKIGERIKQLEVKGKNWIGTPAEVWLGVPLKIKSEVIGVMTVQSYSDPDLFSKNDMEILLSVSDQVAIAIERKRAEEELKIEKARLEELFNSAQEAIVIVDNHSLVLRINPEFTKLFGYSQEEATGKYLDDLVAPGELIKEANAYTEDLAEGRRISFESIRRKKDFTQVHVSTIGAPIIVGKEQLGGYAIYRNISEQKKANHILNALYNISRAVNSTKSLDELFVIIHESLTTIIDTTNFFIALYDKEEDIISFPYFIDEEDEEFLIINASHSSSLTAKVIRSKKPLLSNEN